jgi:hypothetical protein
MKTLNWIFVFTFLTLLSFVSCDAEEISCYNQEMEENHSGTCQQNCPGVCGCDGIFYCNECIANSKGISVKNSEPCN